MMDPRTIGYVIDMYFKELKQNWSSMSIEQLTDARTHIRAAREAIMDVNYHIVGAIDSKTPRPATPLRAAVTSLEDALTDLT